MVSIIDIRNPALANFDLKKQILDGLNRPYNCKSIPTLVLYDDLGLQLFDKITTKVPEYYIADAEVNILKTKSEEMVQHIPDNSIVIELGAGSLRKTKLLLDALNSKRKGIQYYALDVMEKNLVKSLESLGTYENIDLFGFWGTYDDGLQHIKDFPKEKKKTLLWMGASLGNLERHEAKKFLTKLETILNPGDQLMVGMDLRKDPERISLAYDDPQGISRDFIMNGLANINNNILCQQLFDLKNFSFKSTVNDQLGYHESSYLSHKNQTLKFNDEVSIELLEGELIHVEFSFKFSRSEIRELAEQANLNLLGQWDDCTKSYTLNLITKAQTSVKPVNLKKQKVEDWVIASVPPAATS